MASGLLFLLLLGIGGNMFTEALLPVCPWFFCHRCPLGWTEFGGNCYIFESREMSWGEAEPVCNENDGHLTSIKGTDQYNFIRNLIFKAAGSNKQSWVGGTNEGMGNKWMWTDGTPFTFTSWGPGEPNNLGGNEHCMDMNLREMNYVNDENCSETLPFVCIKPMRHIFPPQ